MAEVRAITRSSISSATYVPMMNAPATRIARLTRANRVSRRQPVGKRAGQPPGPAREGRRVHGHGGVSRPNERPAHELFIADLRASVSPAKPSLRVGLCPTADLRQRAER